MGPEVGIGMRDAGHEVVLVAGGKIFGRGGKLDCPGSQQAP